MNKFIKLGKRILALFIVVLLNVNTYAAVGANDGSAFVTKAEFDALVNTFNEQMDSYQSGLNSKIDGAIANYLAGLSGVSVNIVNNISYVSGDYGIQSVDTDPDDVGNDNISWVEGRPNIAFNYAILNRPTLSGSYYVEYSGAYAVSGLEATGGWEIGLTELNEARTKGFWKGSVNTKVYVKLFGQNVSADTYESSNAIIWQGGVKPQSGFTLAPKGGDSSSAFALCEWGATAPGTGYKQGAAINFYTNQTVAYRDIIKTELEHVIVTHHGMECNRFADIDNVTDWSNETDNKYESYHTKMSTLNWAEGIFSSGSYYPRITRGNSAASSTLSIQVEGTAGRDNNQWYNNVMPYVGFLKTLTSWNNVLTKHYDSYVEDMKKYQSDIELDKTKTTDTSVGHLFVGAGAPIVFADQDNTVTVPMKFLDKSKDYDVWVSVGAFYRASDVTAVDSTGKPTNKNIITYKDIQIKNKEDEGSFVASREGTCKNSVRVESGYGELKFKMPKDGYVFVKWAISGNEAHGGGNYLPTKTIQIQKED